MLNGLLGFECHTNLTHHGVGGLLRSAQDLPVPYSGELDRAEAQGRNPGSPCSSSSAADGTTSRSAGQQRHATPRMCRKGLAAAKRGHLHRLADL